MRAVLLLVPLALVGCKQDPIEACVQAEKKSYFLLNCKSCNRDDRENLAAINEPYWRKGCLRAAAGKED